MNTAWQAKVNTPDWSKAPRGYDYAFTTGPNWRGAANRVGDVEFADKYGGQPDGCTLSIGDDGWVICGERNSQWRGPQDGLPPVGMEIEAKINTGWEPGTVVGTVNDGHSKLSIVQHKNGWNPYVARELRPIQSDRDLAIEDMIGALKSQNEGVSELFYRETATALYNAGYRKT